MSSEAFEDGITLLMSTCPDEKTARHISIKLVEEHLAACVQVLPQGVSIFRWQNAVEHVPEHLLLIKTRAANTEAVAARICEMHPYDVPEVLRLDAASLNPAYTSWLRECTSA